VRDPLDQRYTRERAKQETQTDVTGNRREIETEDVIDKHVIESEQRKTTLNIIHLRLWVMIAFTWFSIEHCLKIGSTAPDT